MKLTRSRNAQNAIFFRDMSKGQLLSKSYNLSCNEDSTDNVIDHLPHENSYIHRILAKPSLKAKDNKTNPFFYFISSLVEKGKEINLNFEKQSDGSIKDNRGKIIAKNRIEFQCIINKYLSDFGRKISFECNAESLNDILLDYYDGKDVSDNLEKLKKYINLQIISKKNKLKCSINKNKIPFKISEIKTQSDAPNFELNSSKMELLFSFLTEENGLNFHAFDDFKSVYNYKHLKNKITQAIEQSTECDNIAFPYKKIYQLVLEHDLNFRLKYKTHSDQKYYWFYATEVKNYFRRLLIDKKVPKDKYHTGPNKLNYESDDFVFNQIRKYIVNQLVSGLIQYGKILHYQHTDECGKIKQITSDELSDIQIQESFKKQLFLSISWAVTRLNYFYNYASQNEDAIETGSIKCDILSASQYRSSFINALSDTGSDDSPSSMKLLRAKLATCFNITDSGDSGTGKPITDDQIKELMNQIVCNINALRLNTFHYRNTSITDLFDSGNITSEIFPILFERDINSIQDKFKEQIRSIGISEYYSFDLLNKIFSNSSLIFKLYTPQFAMIPSFKKLYKRGCNIFQSDRQDKRIKWMRELNLDITEKGKLAYKNLLQLLYYHSFLPSICMESSNNPIVKFIKDTKDWNKEESVKNQELLKKNTEHKKKINYNLYRYKDMPDYNSTMTLSQYFCHLQHLQSIRENDDEVVKEKGNYYVDFVQDVFLLAFDDFLENHLVKYAPDLKEPSDKQIDKLKSRETIERLFDKDHPVLKMETNISLNTDFTIMYSFLRLLDQRELSELQHQMIRYGTSLLNKADCNGKDIKILEKVKELIALVQFTIPIQTADSHFRITMNVFDDFFQNVNPKELGQMYYQSDNLTPIPHRSMSLIGRSGALALYKMIFGDTYNITQSDYEYYQSMTSCEFQVDSIPAIIEKKQKEIQELHKDLVKLGASKDKPLTGIERQKVESYKKLAEEIKRYEQLRQKMTFETLYRVYQIHVSILGRFAAFAEDWERDMFFMLTALKARNIINADVEPIFQKGKVVGKLSSSFGKGINKKLFFELCWPDEVYDEKINIHNRLNIRNVAAHLNHITQNISKSNNSFQPNLIEMINKIRTLLAYDIKKQNSVTKVIKELLDKQYKINLELKPKRYDLKNITYCAVEFDIERIESCKIIHLKNLYKKLMIDANSKDMVKLVEILMKYKRNE